MTTLTLRLLGIEATHTWDPPEKVDYRGPIRFLTPLIAQLPSTFNGAKSCRPEAHVFYSLWICLLRWNGSLREPLTEGSTLHMYMDNVTLHEIFYRTNTGQYYPAIQRMNGVRLVLKSIATTLNPSCLDTFEDVCGDSLKKLLDFLQYACLPNPARVQECPPGNWPLPVWSQLIAVALEAFIELNCSDYQLAEDRFRKVFSNYLFSPPGCACCGWHNSWDIGVGKDRQQDSAESSPGSSTVL
jgi:hypothetical protein